MRYCFFLAGCQSRKRLRLVDAVIQQHKPIFWHGPTKHPSSECPIWPFCQTKIRRVLWQVSVDSSMTSVKPVYNFSWWREKEPGEIRKRHLGEMKLMDWPKYSRCFPKESSVLSKRIVDSKQKNRRCSAKESTILCSLTEKVDYFESYL